MNHKWLAALIVVLGVAGDVTAAPAPAPASPFQFVVVGINDVTIFNPHTNSYFGVATSGTNFVCVGAGSIASFAGTNGALAGGYLTNYSAWTAKNITNGYDLNAVTYGAGLFVAGGSDDAIFTNAGGAWSGPLPGGSGNSVSIDGLAFSGGNSNNFASVTASYLATWSASNATNWAVGNDTLPAIVESFRGVTAMGSNRFALCGLGGDVRVSTNGGFNWNLTKEFDFQQPLLNTIASDGSNTLVVAGAGIVEVSTNAGVSWVTNGIPGVTNFYGAVYTGTADNQFILVGSHGTILIAPNSLALASTNNPWVTTNFGINTLRGAAIATAGPLQGILVAAGDNGTIIIGGTPPPAPTNTVGIITNLLTFSPQTNHFLGTTDPNEIEVTNDLHPSGTIAIDWFPNATNGALLAANSTTYVPTDTLCGSNITYWAQARDTRTGFTNSARTAFQFCIIPWAPTNAVVGMTNIITQPNQTNAPLWVDIMINSNNPPANFSVDWFADEAATLPLDNGTETNAGNRFFHTPTTYYISGVYTNWARTRATITSPAGFNVVSTNLTQVIFVLIPPTPTNEIVGLTNLLTTPDQTNAPLWVDVLTNSANPPTNFMVDWFADAALTLPLDNGTETNWGNRFFHTPTNVWLSGSYTTWAETRATVTLRSGLRLVSTNITPVVYDLIPPAPTNVIVGLTNVLSVPFQPLWVDILINASNPPANFNVDWFADALGTINLDNNSEFNTANQFFHTPANTVSGIYTNWTQTRATNTSPAGINVVSTNYTPVTFVVIPPAPFNPQSETNCASDGQMPNGTCGNPTLSVQVYTDIYNPKGYITADWYNQFNVPVAVGTLTYTPTNSAPGLYSYTVFARDVTTGLVSTNSVTVWFKVNELPLEPIGLAAPVTNLLSQPYQTNSTLMVSVTNSVFLITNDAPGAIVVADWYTDSTGTNLAYTGTNNADPLWLAGGGVMAATGVTNFIPTNQLSGTYVYYVRSRVINPGLACTCQSSNLTPVTFVLIPPAPTNMIVGLTNLLTTPSQTNAPLWVDLLVNPANPAANFNVAWFADAGATIPLDNGTETNQGNRFFHTPVDTLSGIYTNWAQTVATNTSPAGTNMFSTNLTEVVYYLIPPAPTNAIVGLTNVLSEPFQPIWVDVLVNASNPPASFNVDWFADSLGTLPLDNQSELNVGNRFFHTPTNVVSGIYTNWTQTRATNTSPSGLMIVSTNYEPVTFVVIPPAPVNPVGATNWAAAQGVPNSGNPALSVSVLTDPYNPAGSITADWYGSPNGGTPLQGGIGTLTYTPADTAPGNYTYYAQARDAATELTSTNLTAVTFVVFPLPTPAVPVPASSAFTLSLLTSPLQTNTPLTVSVASWDFAPGATVTVDWYTDAGGVNLAYTATNNVDANWFVGGGVVGATNTLTFIPSNVLAGTNNFWARARVVNPGFTNNTGISSSLTEFAYVLVPPAPATNGLVVTNVLTFPSQTNQPLWVAVQTNAANPATNFNVSWYQDAESTVLITNTSASGGNYFYYTPTNLTAGSYTNWALTIATNTSPAGVNVASTNLTPVVFVLIPPAPTNSGGDQVNCAGVANPALVATLPFAIPGAVINWYSDVAGTQLLPNGAATDSFTPTNTVAGEYTFYAQTMVNNYASTNLTPVTLVLESCTNPPEAMVFGQPATNVITWYGNLLLESTTNLATSPIYWITNSTGLPGQTNYWTNSTVAVPMQFFRLYAPTN